MAQITVTSITADTNRVSPEGVAELVIEVTFSDGMVKLVGLSGNINEYVPKQVASALTVLAMNILHHVGEEVDFIAVMEEAVRLMENHVKS